MNVHFKNLTLWGVVLRYRVLNQNRVKFCCSYTKTFARNRSDEGAGGLNYFGFGLYVTLGRTTR